MPKLDGMTAAQLRTWLKGKGHDKNKVDKAKMTSKQERKAALLALHGVTAAEYRAAGGTPDD